MLIFTGEIAFAVAAPGNWLVSLCALITVVRCGAVDGTREPSAPAAVQRPALLTRRAGRRCLALCCSMAAAYALCARTDHGSCYLLHF